MKGAFYCLLFILLLNFIIPAVAQEERWQDEQIILSEELTWQHLLNPARLVDFDQQQDYTSFTLGHNYQEGEFQRPQWPSQFRSTSLNIDGLSKTSNIIFAGSFNYQLARFRQQFWRNTYLSPEETPFIWADSSAGRWHSNLFSAKVVMATSMSKKINFGLELLYCGGSGDRKNDPRPLFRQQSIAIKPAIYFPFRQGSLGLFLGYRRYSEDNEIGFLSVQNTLLYRLKGYGTFSRTPFVSGERVIRSDRGLLGIQFKSNSGWEAEGVLQFTGGKVTEGIANPNPQGKWNDEKLNISIQHLSSEINSISWKLHYFYFNQEGTDPVFQAINYYMQKQQIRAILGWEPRDNNHFEFSAGWFFRRQRDIVAATEANIIHANIALSAFFDRNKTRHYPTLSWYHPLQQQLELGNPGEISRVLVVPDFNILKRGFLRTSYNLEIKLLPENDLFFKVEPMWQYNHDLQFFTIYSALIYSI